MEYERQLVWTGAGMIRTAHVAAPLHMLASRSLILLWQWKSRPGADCLFSGVYTWLS